MDRFRQERNVPDQEGIMAEVRSRSDWTKEEKYWRDNYRQRPYVSPDQSYDSWGPAYRFGYDATDRYEGKSWNDVESDLRRDSEMGVVQPLFR